MAQSKKMSFIEGITNTITSFILSWIMYFSLIPWMFKIHIDPMQSAGIVITFNITSLVRQFILRRIFNSLEK